MAISTRTRFYTLAAASSLFLLAGCGEGYEQIRTDEIFPYGNQRTAGSTIAYVRAKLMPEKELVIQPVGRKWSPEIIQDMQKVFDEQQIEKK